ncbi:hypothetical protein BKA57DRAFT_476067, partial [Linnemannia elongata]
MSLVLLTTAVLDIPYSRTTSMLPSIPPLLRYRFPILFPRILFFSPLALFPFFFVLKLTAYLIVFLQSLALTIVLPFQSIAPVFLV